MIKNYAYKDGLIENSINSDNNSVWLNVIDPTIDEIEFLVENIGIDPEFIEASLDLEERSRIDDFDDQILIIVNASVKKDSKYDKNIYETIPIGIIIKNKTIVTVCKKELEAIIQIVNNKRVKHDIINQARFVTKLIYFIATSYLKALRMIDSRTEQIEKLLYKDTKKEYLLELLNMEKTLVYFNTALNGNEIVLKRILRTNLLQATEDDCELLEDTIIEIQQASEMAGINSRIINSIRSAFESINNNSLNIIMKSLASITIILNIPMFITSFFGMNVRFPAIVQTSLLFLALLCIAMCLITYIIYKIMKKKDML